MMRTLFLLGLAGLCYGQSKKPQPPQELAAIRAEPQPEKRYWSALEFASSRIDAARRHYQEGNLEEFQKNVTTLEEAVQLCDETLRGTGKNPSKSPRHFKRAELKEREIVRRLRTLEDEVGVEDRTLVTRVRTHVSDLHDELLFDIMGRKK